MLGSNEHSDHDRDRGEVVAFRGCKYGPLAEQRGGLQPLFRLRTSPRKQLPFLVCVR